MDKFEHQNSIGHHRENSKGFSKYPLGNFDANSGKKLNKHVQYWFNSIVLGELYWPSSVSKFKWLWQWGRPVILLFYKVHSLIRHKTLNRWNCFSFTLIPIAKMLQHRHGSVGGCGSVVRGVPGSRNIAATLLLLAVIISVK